MTTNGAAGCNSPDGNSGEATALGATEPSYMMQFTCNKCSKSQSKTFSKHSYHHGISPPELNLPRLMSYDLQVWLLYNVNNAKFDIL